MGFAVSWVAVRETDSDKLLQSLRLVSTSKKVTYGDTLFTGRALSTGWFILFINKCDHRFVQQSSLATTSKSADLVACSIEEHVMWSAAELWRNGGQVWRVEHSAQKGIFNIDSSGELPDEFAVIEESLRAEQTAEGGAESHVGFYFDLPLLLAKSLVGFKHDEASPEDDDFSVFEPSEALATEVHQPWWKLWGG